jgi:thioester reductase-like protein
MLTKDTPDAKIYCLIRGSQGEEKLLKTAHMYGGSDIIKLYLSKKKIVVLQGDLEEVRFGLTKAHFTELANSIDCIIHCGAYVNWMFDYTLLRRANVLGTLDVLRLATTAGHSSKVLLFIGSVGAFAAGEEQNENMKFDCLADKMNSLQPYSATKRVAEILVRKAIDLGLKGKIVRPGTVSGSYLSGLCHKSDAINRFLQGVCELKMAPDVVNLSVSMCPVEYVAGVALAVLISDFDQIPTCFTVVAQRSFTVEDVARCCSMWTGEVIRMVSSATFGEAVLQNDCSLRPLVSYYVSEVHELPLWNETAIFTALNTAKLSRQKGVRYPVADDELIFKYLAVLVPQMRLQVVKRSSSWGQLWNSFN